MQLQFGLGWTEFENAAIQREIMPIDLETTSIQMDEESRARKSASEDPSHIELPPAPATAESPADHTAICGSTTSQPIEGAGTPPANVVTECDNVDVSDAELDQLAAEIREMHADLQAKLITCTRQKAALGERLLQANARVLARGRKGEGFREWVDKKCGFSHTTAYRFMRLFSKSKEDPALLDLGITEAYLRAGIYVPASVQVEGEGDPTVGNGESNIGSGRKNKKGKSRTNTAIKLTLPSLIAPFVAETADGYVAELSREKWPGQLAALQADPRIFVRMLEHKLHLSLEEEAAK